MLSHGHRIALTTVAIAGFLALASCAGPTPKPKPETGGIASYKVGTPYQINGVWYYPQEDYDYNENGIASYYGGERSGVNFHGRYTANGEVYDMEELTAAHQTLPMPSLVRVTNLENGRQIKLRVNDRGPFVRGRIIDVSRKAARLLGFEGQGTAKVRVEILPDESRELKLALLNQSPPEGERVVVAAVPRPSVTSDALAPLPGVRTAPPPPQVSTLPPPATLAPSPSPRPNPRPAPPIQVTPAPSEPAAVAVASLPPPPLPRPSFGQALPIAYPPGQAPMVINVQVRPTKIYVQAGAFGDPNRASLTASKIRPYGTTAISAVRINGQNLYRVRLGPIANVDEADRILDQVAAVVPESKIVVD